MFGAHGGNENSRKKISVPLLIGLACAAFMVLAVTANASRISNAVHRMSKPETYYRYVEKRAVERLVDNLGSIYTDYIKEMVDYDNKSVIYDMSAEIGEEGEAILRLLGFAGIDLSWLKQAAFTVNAGINKNVVGFGVDVSVNKQNLLSGDIAFDAEKGMGYVSLPDFNSKAAACDIGRIVDTDIYKECMEVQGALVKAMPTEAEVKSILGRYGKIILDNISDVKLWKGEELRAGDMGQKCARITVTVDGEALRNIAEAVVDAMGSDRELEKCVTALAEALDQDTDYNGIVEELRSRLANTTEGAGEIAMEVYVDGKGEIIGRVITFTEENYRGGTKKNTISCKKVSRGGSFRYELALNDVFAVNGSGKDNASTLNGDFSVDIGGRSYVAIQVKNLNKKQAERGCINGMFTISPSGGLMEELGVPKKLRSINIVLDVAMSQNSVKVDAMLMKEKDKYFSVAATIKRQNGAKVSVPGKAVEIEDGRDLMSWLGEADLGPFLKKLGKIGVSDEIMEVVEELEKALEDGNWGSLYYKMYYLF